MNRKPFLYLGPDGLLAERLARLAAHRRHVALELKGLERFLREHPELRKRLKPLPRLVVSNPDPDPSPTRPAVERYRPRRGDGPEAA
jgi:hypothetical protein